MKPMTKERWDALSDSEKAFFQHGYITSQIKDNKFTTPFDLFLSRLTPPIPVVDVNAFQQMQETLEQLKIGLTPVTSFFAKEVKEPVKRISAKKRKQMEMEEYEKQMDLKARKLL